MEQAQASKDDPAGKLLELARTYPNSAIAGKAMIAAAEAYEAAGDPRHAIRVLRDMWFKYADSPDKARIMESECAQLPCAGSAPRELTGEQGAMGNMEAAAAALARVASLPGEPRLQKSLKLRDGTVINAGTSAADALETMRKYRGAEASKSLPDFKVPPFVRRTGGDHHPWPSAFLSPDNDRDVVPNIKVLVPVLRDYSRADRVVACTVDGVLDLLAAGQVKPLAASHALSEEAKSCAWIGDTLLAWGASQVVSLRSATGDVAWKIDLHEMQPIEVVRIGDNAQTLPGVAADPNAVVIQGNGRQFQVRNGQRVIFRNGMRAPRLPRQFSRPSAWRWEAAEEIVDVRPVGDHVLLTTSNGRIFSVELGTGRLAWQTRLSDRPVDRIVANEDFTVVRVNDESSVRLAAFDTATGQMRCTRSWTVQSGMFPINIALAPDSTLVYTLPDRLCLKDLYKPWPDASDKEVTSNPSVRLFEIAKAPDQLLISEGRVLVLADDGTVKHVRVHSLETGQPVLLRYRSPQGDQDIDRILDAGKSDQASLRVVGSHLYITHPSGVISYNLDRPDESWSSHEEGPQSKRVVRETFLSQKFLVLLSEPTPADNDLPPVPLVGPAGQPPAPGQNPNVNPNGAAPASPMEYQLQFFARYPAPNKTAESGRLDYVEKVADPSGFTGSWQSVDGGFYYLTTDNKLHMLRGSQTEK